MFKKKKKKEGKKNRIQRRKNKDEKMVLTVLQPDRNSKRESRR